VTFNLMQLFQQQYRIIGSFGASMRNIRDGLGKAAQAASQASQAGGHDPGPVRN
jgi:hypothetical protein